MSKNVKRLVVKSALRVLKVDDIGVDTSYQREVKRGHKKIVSDFNEDALGVPLIGERSDGSLWVVDGLQRLTALKKLGKKEVRCEVFASRGPEHEAEVFKLVNMNRTRLDVREEMRAMLAAHDPDAWKLKEVVESCGYRLNLHGTSNPDITAKSLGSFRMLMRVMKTSGRGEDSIKFALRMLDGAWPGDRLGVYTEMIEGFTLFWSRMGGVVDEKRLLDRLRTVTAQKILYAASASTLSVSASDKSGKIAEQLEKIYSKRMPRRL